MLGLGGAVPLGPRGPRGTGSCSRSWALPLVWVCHRGDAPPACSVRRSGRNRWWEQLEEPPDDRPQAADRDRARPPRRRSANARATAPRAAPRPSTRSATSGCSAATAPEVRASSWTSATRGSPSTTSASVTSQPAGAARVEHRRQRHGEGVDAHVVGHALEPLLAAPAAEGVEHRLEVAASVGELVGPARRRSGRARSGRSTPACSSWRSRWERTSVAMPGRWAAQVGEPLRARAPARGRRAAPTARRRRRGPGRCRTGRRRNVCPPCAQANASSERNFQLVTWNFQLTVSSVTGVSTTDDARRIR